MGSGDWSVSEKGLTTGILVSVFWGMCLRWSKVSGLIFEMKVFDLEASLEFALLRGESGAAVHNHTRSSGGGRGKELELLHLGCYLPS